MKTVEERLKSYEPLWENWSYSGNFLGEGAMSSVFEIHSSAMGFQEIAALKIITVKSNLRGEVQIPESTINEIKILQTLSSCPNIIQYHDSTQRKIYNDENRLAGIDILIKMEKLRSLNEADKLTESQIIKLAKDMCTALICAAEHNIIHRDIKPQNIFVDKDGAYKLGDFGIAKIVSEFSGSYTMNVGTLAYTAPEIQSAHSGKYDIASDIYSLGLVLYVFLNNGYMPFAKSCSSLNEAILKRLSGAPFPSPATGSKNLKTIVMRACNADLAKRYRSPKEMLDDLELLSTGGRKLIADPFATLDANIDLVEVSAPTLVSSFSPSGSRGTEMHAGSSPEKAISGSKSRLRINMSSSSRSTPASESSAVHSASADSSVPKTDASMTSRGSRLKINMRSSAPKDTPAVSVSHEETPKKENEESKDTSSRFSRAPNL